MGNNAAAEPLLRQALEIRRKSLGEKHPSFAKSLNNLAELYISRGDYPAAESLLRQALEIKRTDLGEEHPSFATSLNNLATLYDAMGDYAAAEPFLHALFRCRICLEPNAASAQFTNPDRSADRDSQEQQVAPESMNVNVFGNTAISTGVFRANGIEAGKPYARRERFVDTWIYKGGNWVCVATNATPVLR